MNPPQIPSLTAREVMQEDWIRCSQTKMKLCDHDSKTGQAAVVPMHVKKDLPKGILYRIIEQAGLTLEQFNKL